MSKSTQSNDIQRQVSAVGEYIHTLAGISNFFTWRVSLNAGKTYNFARQMLVRLMNTSRYVLRILKWKVLVNILRLVFQRPKLEVNKPNPSQS